MTPRRSILCQILGVTCVGFSAVAAAAEFEAGHLFVTLGGTNRIVEFDQHGAVVATFGETAPLLGAWGLAFLPDGRLLVASRENDAMAVFATDRTYEGGFVPAGLDGPQGIDVGPAGRIYVGSTHTDSVIVLTPGFSAFDAIAGYPVWPIDGTTMLAFNADNRLLIGSFFNSHLLECQDDGQATADLTGLATAPECVSLASDGALLVSSAADDKVRVLAAGRFLLPDLDRTSAEMDQPMGVAEGPDGRYYVASAANGRVLALGAADVDVWRDDAGSFPVGVAWSPWWFEARVGGELLPAQSTTPLVVDEIARLAVFPGNGRAFVVPAPGSVLAAHFGGEAFVFHGVDQRDAKSKSKRSFCGQQASRRNDDVPLASLGITLKQKVKKGVVDVVSAKGTLHASSGSVIFRGSIKTTKALN
jgi:hypothetical protein